MRERVIDAGDAAIEDDLVGQGLKLGVGIQDAAGERHRSNAQRALGNRPADRR